MRQLCVDEIKKYELDILIYFRDFCEKNQIRYFLSNGTLLGAVKYKGFIPWDDDVDVLVPRKDYDRLIKCFKDNDRYRLFAYEKNTAYKYPFAKLCDMQTRKVETGINNGISLGIDIDIFPLDRWDSDLKKAKKEMKSIRKNMFCLALCKLKKPDSVNPVKWIIKLFLMFFCKMFGTDYFLHRIIAKSCEDNQNKSTYVGCKAWCIYKEKEIIPAKAFEKTIKVEFEGEKFSAPKGYDTYLRSLYGDYEPDPPIEDQCTHHGFSAYAL